MYTKQALTFPDLSTADTTSTLLLDPVEGDLLLSPSGIGMKLSSRPSRRCGLDLASDSLGGSLYFRLNVPERDDDEIAQLEPQEQQLEELLPE